VVEAACAGTLGISTTGTLQVPEVVEASGLAWWDDGATEGVFVHNDSGDSARFFALGLDGAWRGTYVLDGATNRDFEDMAASVDGSVLWLADIGDNARARSDAQVYRVPRPAVPAGPSPVSVPWTVLTLRYPDGAHNAEALVADPVSGRLFVLTKQSGSFSLYSADPAGAGIQEMLFEGTFALGAGEMVTGADVSRDGTQIALRTYGRVLVFRRDAGATLAAALGAVPCAVPVSKEAQGEAVAFSADGRRLVTVSEGSHPPLHVHTG
jgi:hypothetical protein